MEPEHNRRRSDKLPKLVPIQDRRQELLGHVPERRGINPQQGYESHDLDDVNFALDSDKEL